MMINKTPPFLIKIIGCEFWTFKIKLIIQQKKKCGFKTFGTSVINIVFVLLDFIILFTVSCSATHGHIIFSFFFSCCL